MYNVPLAFHKDAVMKEVKMRIGKRGESGDCLVSCMQMTWFWVVSGRPKGNSRIFC